MEFPAARRILETGSCHCSRLLQYSEAAPATPLSALLLAEICATAGLPPGVVNILPGGTEVGRQLTDDPRVDGISFTGSTATGTAVMRAAADTIKRLTLELGGKNAAIIFADADLDRAAATSANSAFGNAGQSCSARSRLLVHRKAVERFTQAFRAATAKLEPGPPMDRLTTLGPLISKEHRERVEASVREAIDYGADLNFGGKPIAGPGFFFEPTILSSVAPGNPLFKREVFGPVCSITPFDSEGEAIELANSGNYGLTASVWSRDISCALRVSRALRTGMVAVNNLPSATRNAVFAPFGGSKRSGIGRELGLSSLEFYTETKTITIDVNN